LDVIHRVVQEIKTALLEKTTEKLIIGHGSGSFGHFEAQKYNTQAGVFKPGDWNGFVEVWHKARALNQLVVEAFHAAGLPVIAFPPSAFVVTDHGRISDWNIEPIKMALEKSIIPIVQGDVVFDHILGGTIVSTEEVFSALAYHFPPLSVLLAGVEEGIWRDFPKCTTLITRISESTLEGVRQFIGRSDAPDVTGGMYEKTIILQDIIRRNPECKGMIFSGMQPGNITKALRGEDLGTIFTIK
jgi:isopentenyl phosphate kinase